MERAVRPLRFFPLSLPNSVRTAIHSVSRDAEVGSINMMELLLYGQKTQRRFQTWLISVFSGIAPGLAALGIFAVMHYSVAALHKPDRYSNGTGRGLERYHAADARRFDAVSDRGDSGRRICGHMVNEGNFRNALRRKAA